MRLKKWKKTNAILSKILQLCIMMQYIPQAPPFQMVDQLISTNETHTVCSFTIPEAHIFVDQGVFTEPGIIEHMTQTAAAGSGYAAALESKAAPVGFIGAIKNFKLHALPKVGEKITTTIEVMHTIGDVQVIVATTTVEESLIATAEFKIFLQP